MIDLHTELEKIEAEGASKYTVEERKELKDIPYLCLKCGRHLLNLGLGKTHDKETGVHEMSKILWYVLRLCGIFDINIKL